MSKSSPIGTLNLTKKTVKIIDGWATIGEDVFQVLEGRENVTVNKEKLAAVIPAIGGYSDRFVNAELELIEIDNCFNSESAANQRAEFLNNSLEIFGGEFVKEGDICWEVNAAGPKMVVVYCKDSVWKMVSPECCSHTNHASGVKIIAPTGQGRGGGHVIRQGYRFSYLSRHATKVYRTFKEARDNSSVGNVAAAVRNGQVQGMMAFACGSVAGFSTRKMDWKDWQSLKAQWAKVFG